MAVSASRIFPYINHLFPLTSHTQPTMRLLIGVALLSTCLVARETAPYPESYSFQPYDSGIADARSLASGCPIDGQIQCPTPNFQTQTAHWPCLRYEEMCDGKHDCPQGEDEHPSMCMYHRILDAEMNRIRSLLKDAHRSP